MQNTSVLLSSFRSTLCTWAHYIVVVFVTSCGINTVLCQLLKLGPVHTYTDIFESATFSLRIQKFLRPHLAYSNRIRPSTRIGWYPDSL